jgi:hypothetical protein
MVRVRAGSEDRDFPPGSFCVEAIRGMIETVLHILSKDPGEKPAKRARGKDNEGHKN